MIPELDLFGMKNLHISQFFQDNTADMYVDTSNGNERLELGVETQMSLSGVCGITSEIDFFCDIFEKDTSVFVQFNAYASNRGFGIRMDLVGNIKIASQDNPVIRWLLQLIGWPTDGMRLGLEVQLELLSLDATDYTIEARLIPKFGGILDGASLTRCSRQDECGGDGFCIPFLGMCGPADPLQQLCLSNPICKTLQSLPWLNSGARAVFEFGFEVIELIAEVLSSKCGNSYQHAEVIINGIIEIILKDTPFAPGSFLDIETVIHAGVESIVGAAAAAIDGAVTSLVEDGAIMLPNRICSNGQASLVALGSSSKILSCEKLGNSGDAAAAGLFDDDFVAFGFQLKEVSFKLFS